MCGNPVARLDLAQAAPIILSKEMVITMSAHGEMVLTSLVPLQ